MKENQDKTQGEGNRWEVIVTHSLGFFSDYEIEARDYHEAERIATKTFLEQFCGGTLVTEFRGVKETHSVSAFTIDKYNLNSK